MQHKCVKILFFVLARPWKNPIICKHQANQQSGCQMFIVLMLHLDNVIGNIIYLWRVFLCMHAVLILSCGRQQLKSSFVLEDCYRSAKWVAMFRKGRKVTLNYENKTQVAKSNFSFERESIYLSLLFTARFSQLLLCLNSLPPASLTFRPQQ